MLSTAVKRLVYETLRRLGFELHRVRLDQFELDGLRYESDPCSVGRTFEGEHAARGALQRVRNQGLRDLRVLDLCCGVGVIGLGLYGPLHREGAVRSVDFADINVFNLSSVTRAIHLNGFADELARSLHTHLSDGLAGIPGDRRYDLIVCNPPHFEADDRAQDWLTPGRLCSYDRGHRFHRGFYQRCHEFLAEGGRVWMLENEEAAKPDDFLSMIDANDALRFAGSEPLDGAPGFYWMVIERA